MRAVRIRLTEEDLKDIKPGSELHKRAVDTLKDCQDGAAYLQYARERLHDDGDLEFDDDAVVSLGADDGAYVMAWVWVSDDDMRENGYLEEDDAED